MGQGMLTSMAVAIRPVDPKHMLEVGHGKEQAVQPAAYHMNVFFLKINSFVNLLLVHLVRTKAS